MEPVLREWLSNCCSLPKEIKAKLEQMIDARKEPKIRWEKRLGSVIDLNDPALTKLEEEFENPKAEPDLEKLAALQERILKVLSQVKAIPAEVKDKIETKFKRHNNEIEYCESLESVYYNGEDYESSYDIIELREFIFLIGGSEDGQGNEPVNTVQAYDCTNKTWETLPPLPARTTACSAATITGIPAIVVLGGYGGWKALNTVQVFDFVTRRWSVIQYMRKRRWGAFAMGTEHGVVVAGGCDQGSVLRSAELYSVRRKTWYTLPSMKTPRCNFAGALIGRKLIVAGGGDGFYFNSALRSVEIFDGDKGEWRNLPHMKYRRYGCTAVTRDRLFIVLGGCDEEGKDVVEVEVFNEQMREWSEIPPIPASGSLCRATIVDNKLLVINADSSVHKAFTYDFELQRWDEYMDLPKGRNAFAIATIGV
ncbi:kelch-like protein 5 [Nematostella vectensis]|uniref:kelch-like protein 5 n=1 Tax=Nematostella vectensis TaxID=45351 RepID=UPI0013901246|nr:kelch-like protein 5 [Nematostella vectensis]